MKLETKLGTKVKVRTLSNQPWGVTNPAKSSQCDNKGAMKIAKVVRKRELTAAITQTLVYLKALHPHST